MTESGILLTRNRIQSHPSVDFIIVINPASGPGPDSLPDTIYAREIIRLNSYANVRTIGYVPMNYGKKPIESTYADITKYCGWGNQNPSLAMQGVFLDESPQIADPHNITYVENVRNYVKSQKALSSGLLGKSIFLGSVII
jgi:Spherulation-specific family 4